MLVVMVRGVPLVAAHFEAQKHYCTFRSGRLSDVCVLLPYSTVLNTVSASGLGTHRIISLLLMTCFPAGQQIPRGVLTDGSRRCANN